MSQLLRRVLVTHAVPCQPCAQAGSCLQVTKSDPVAEALRLLEPCFFNNWQSLDSRVECAACSPAPCKLRDVRNGRVVEVMCRAATFLLRMP